MNRSTFSSHEESAFAEAVRCAPLDVVHTPASTDDELHVFVLSGHCELKRRVAGEWLHAAATFRGGVLFTRSREPLKVIGDKQTGGVALHIRGDVLEKNFDGLMRELEYKVAHKLDPDTVVDGLVNLLCVAGKASAQCVQKPIIEALILRLSRLAHGDAVSASYQRAPLPAWRLRRVTDLVDAQLHTPISLADMAGAAGLSPMHFAAQFKATTGTRPHRYLLARRIARAKHLLEETNATILDVAIAVGFQTQAHFATVFKQHESVTPGQWRTTHASNARTGHRSNRRGRAPARTICQQDIRAVG